MRQQLFPARPCAAASLVELIGNGGVKVLVDGIQCAAGVGVQDGRSNVGVAQGYDSKSLEVFFRRDNTCVVRLYATDGQAMSLRKAAYSSSGRRGYSAERSASSNTVSASSICAAFTTSGGIQRMTFS